MAPKIAIVTGAASGIGKHFAGVLVGSGDAYRLALADINEAGLRDAFVPSDRVRLHRLDVRSVQDWQVLIEDTLQAFGRIDYLFNIAGGGRLGFLLDQPIENVDFVIDVNLKGPVIGMKLVAGVMARQGGGHIINVGSLAGLSPTPGNALYSAAKSGLRAASLAAAVELRKQGVYVTLIAPDVVDTPLDPAALRAAPGCSADLLRIARVDCPGPGSGFFQSDARQAAGNQPAPLARLAGQDQQPLPTSHAQAL